LRSPDKLLAVFGFLYVFPVVFVLVSGIPVVSCLITCIAYVVYNIRWRGESFRTALRELELAAPLIILWVLGVDWIESSAWPPPHVLYTDPQTGQNITCGTEACLARMGYGELWTGFLWLMGVLAKRVF
jgi:hypothetical protein